MLAVPVLTQVSFLHKHEVLSGLGLELSRMSWNADEEIRPVCAYSAFNELWGLYNIRK